VAEVSSKDPASEPPPKSSQIESEEGILMVESSTYNKNIEHEFNLSFNMQTEDSF
jgi:hypothetical protein